jgi:H+/Cl- antiporter ClcA
MIGLARALAEWTLFGALIGALAGSASALFLYLLELVTDLRGGHAGLVAALPLACVAIGAIYQRYGQPIRGGNNLVIDTIHDGGPRKSALSHDKALRRVRDEDRKNPKHWTLGLR